jgi:SAM-dependent methyltransferase
MQLARFPQATTLLERYAQAESTDYLPEEAGQRETARTTLDMIERHVRCGALLDVGCWVGFLVDEARKHGWRAVGLEPSEFASAYARERLGLDVLTADLFTAGLEPSSCDAVVLADVIEHLPDPGAALDRIATLATPGAVLHLSLPDAGSRVARFLGARWWSVIPTHVQYFTRGSLKTLLARHGWDVLELSTAPKAFTVRYYLGRIRGYSEPLSNPLVRVAEVARIADRVWAPDFRDRMAVVARAPDSKIAATDV